MSWSCHTVITEPVERYPYMYPVNFVKFTFLVGKLIMEAEMRLNNALKTFYCHLLVKQQVLAKYILLKCILHLTSITVFYQQI